MRSYFGEIALVSESCKRTATVIAIMFVELLELRADALRGIVKYHPEYESVIASIARERNAGANEGQLMSKMTSLVSQRSGGPGGAGLGVRSKRFSTAVKERMHQVAEGLSAVLAHRFLHIEVLDPSEGRSSLLVKAWSLLVLCMYVSLSVYAPVQTCFDWPIVDPIALYTVHGMFDVFVLVDLYIRLHTALVINHMLVFSRHRIWNETKHVKVQFLLSLPWDLLAYTTSEPTRWLSILQIPRLPLLFASDRISTCFPRSAASASRDVFNVAVVSIGILHFIACCWMGIALAYSKDKDYKTWVDTVHYLDHALPLDIYVTAFYFSLSTTFAIGMGEIHPVNNPERMVVAGILIVGTVIRAAVLSSFAVLIQVITNPFHSPVQFDLWIYSATF